MNKYEIVGVVGEGQYQSECRKTCIKLNTLEPLTPNAYGLYVPLPKRTIAITSTCHFWTKRTTFKILSTAINELVNIYL